MSVRPSKQSRTATRKANRRLALEPLGMRVVLSAAGIGPPPIDTDFAEVTAREIDRTFIAIDNSVQLNAVSGLAGNASGEYVVGDVDLSHYPGDRHESLAPTYGNPGLPYQSLESFSLAASQALAAAGAFGTNLVLGPSSVLTIVIGAPSSPLAQPLVYDNDAPAMPHNWQSTPSAGGPFASYAAPPSTPDRIVPVQPQTADVRAAAPPVDTSRLVGWLPSFIQTATVQVSAANASSSTWSAMTSPFDSSYDTPAQSKTTLVPNRWETLETDEEGGLIELEEPLAQQRNWRLQEDRNAGDQASEEPASPADLKTLLEQLWSGWGKAWDAFGNLAQTRQAAESAAASNEAVATATEIAAKGIDVELMDGMIELAAEGPTGTVSTQAHVAEMPAGDGGKVRMDAGLALYQEFELATAPDAVPPATAANVQPRDGESSPEKSAKAEDTEQRPRSAALVGAGLLASIPFSLHRIRRQDDDDAQRRLRLNLERLD